MRRLQSSSVSPNLARFLALLRHAVTLANDSGRMTAHPEVIRLSNMEARPGATFASIFGFQKIVHYMIHSRSGRLS